LRVLQVLLEGRLAPDDPGVLVAVAIGVPLGSAGFLAIKSVELGAKLVLRRLADIVTGLTFSEGGFSSGRVLRERRTCECG
jgi:hypothetical protein